MKFICNGDGREPYENGEKCTSSSKQEPLMDAQNDMNIIHCSLGSELKDSTQHIFSYSAINLQIFFFDSNCRFHPILPATHAWNGNFTTDKKYSRNTLYGYILDKDAFGWPSLSLALSPTFSMFQWILNVMDYGSFNKNRSFFYLFFISRLLSWNGMHKSTSNSHHWAWTMQSKYSYWKMKVNL